ncbi:MAG: LPS export ABC transporter permease LptF [Chromatiaceae bacterium]|jgi:lipopolysaccharide export system permease protein|nr:LPS export ABC transporter permease LptF [Chromatiaceae bacterium]
MLGILDRYILAEVAKVFLAIAGVLILIVASLLFLRTLEEVSLGALGSQVVLRYLGLQLLRDAPSLLPPAFFIAALVALGRMARDSELIAIAACGLGPGRIYRSLLYFALPAAALTAWLSLALQPWATGEIQRVRAQQKEQTTQIAGIQRGRFYVQDAGRLTLYVEDIVDGRRLHNVFIHDQREGATRVVLSKEGYHSFDEATGDHILTLRDGRRYDGIPGRGDYEVGEFERYSLRIEPRRLEDVPNRKRSAQPTPVLLGSEDPADLAELYHRVAGPLSVIVLALIAIPLSASSPRQRASGRMLLAFLTYFGFLNLQRLAETWLETGVTPVWMGSLWYQLLLLVLVYVALLPESYWVRRLRRRPA